MIMVKLGAKNFFLYELGQSVVHQLNGFLSETGLCSNNFILFWYGSS